MGSLDRKWLTPAWNTTRHLRRQCDTMLCKLFVAEQLNFVWKIYTTKDLSNFVVWLWVNLSPLLARAWSVWTTSVLPEIGNCKLNRNEQSRYQWSKNFELVSVVPIAIRPTFKRLLGSVSWRKTWSGYQQRRSTNWRGVTYTRAWNSYYHTFNTRHKKDDFTKSASR